MPTAGIRKRIAESAPRHNGRIVGAYYLLTMLAGVLVIFFHGRLAFAADLITTVAYVAITILFYALSKKRRATDDRDLNRERDRTGSHGNVSALRNTACFESKRARRNQSHPHDHQVPAPAA